MTATTRTRITATALYPGFVMPEDGVPHDIADSGLSTALAAIGDDGLWFCIEVRTVIEKRWTDGLGGERWLPDGPAVSHRIYVGEQFHVDELQHDLAGDRLRSNAAAYGADRVVLTRRTNWQPIMSSDVVLTVDELADELARAQA